MQLMFRFLQPKNERRTKKLAECGIEFTEGILKGIRLIGFTINENEQGIFVNFPAYIHKKQDDSTTQFDFLWELETGALERLEDIILDEFEKVSEREMPPPKTILRIESTAMRG